MAIKFKDASGGTIDFGPTNGVISFGIVTPPLPKSLTNELDSLDIILKWYVENKHNTSVTIKTWTSAGTPVRTFTLGVGQTSAQQQENIGQLSPGSFFAYAYAIADDVDQSANGAAYHLFT